MTESTDVQIIRHIVASADVDWEPTHAAAKPRRFRSAKLDLSLAVRGLSGPSIDGDGEDSADDGEEFCRKHHGVG